MRAGVRDRRPERRRLSDADLIVAADGLNSRIRARYADTSSPTSTCASAASSGSARTSCSTPSRSPSSRPSGAGSRRTPIASIATRRRSSSRRPRDVWLRGRSRPNGARTKASRSASALFARYLDGHKLMSNARHLRGSAQWISFPRVVCRTWIHDRAGTPVVLMGDAAHTAHFSIGSGTKLALEDAIALARSIDEPAGRSRGRAARTTRTSAASKCCASRTRRATRPSGSRTCERYAALEPEQFAYSLLTRQPAHLAREPAPARQALPGDVRSLVRDARRHRGRRAAPAGAADVHAVHAARRDAQESRRRLADGAVLGGRRHADRLSPRASGRARAWAAPGWCSPR